MANQAWKAKWIWCAGETQPKNFYLCLRKTFSLESPAKRANIRITADSRYHLFINGTLVARGPARCDRRWQYFDTWEITRFLHVGKNVIAALVHHYGEWTFSYMLGRGGFLAEADIECLDGTKVQLLTDETWHVSPAEAWERNLPRMSIQLGFPEVYDARREVEGWAEPQFEESGWEPAIVLGPPGIEPWPNLVPRDIPAMQERPLQGERVVDSGEVGPVRAGHYVDLLRVVWNPDNGVAYLATYVWSPRGGNFEIHAGSQEAIKLWINSEMVISHLVERGPAPDQEVVPVYLASGWNTVLAKIIQGRGQWHFYFRIEGDRSESLIYSREPLDNPGGADQVQPWSLIAPFDSPNVKVGFEAVYPPEKELNFSIRNPGKGGKEIGWISAGVTQEAMLTSVMMSRETRLPFREARIENLDGLVSGSVPATVYPGAQHGCYAVIDFGKEVTGYPQIEVDDASGVEIIDLGYSEILQTYGGEIIPPASGKLGIVNADRDGVHYADRYICKRGKQRFQTFDKRAFRYVQIDVRNVSRPIKIGPVSILFSTYPVEYKGRFECSDQLLNKIWEVGRWTVQLNMEDGYTDCPWRERGQWWGDARIQAMVNYYTFGGLKLIRKGLRQIAQSQNDEGLTWGVYPTDWPGGILPTFTLLWICTLHDYYWFSNDKELVNDLFPTVERSLQFFERYSGEGDLLSDLPYWVFVDWADVETRGEAASVNALYHGALSAAAELGDVIARSETATRYRELAAQVRLGLNTHLWDDSIPGYREALLDGEVTPKISEQSNAWAIVFDVARPDRRSEIIESVFDPAREVIRAGSPYFSFYLLTAFAKSGACEKALEYIRSHWKMMLDWGATTWWEMWKPTASFCHGWSAAPTYFLSAEILGAKPAMPGWEEVLIQPHPVDLAWAKGVVPTPKGDVIIDWKSGEAFDISVQTPMRASVTIPTRRKRLILVNGRTSPLPTGITRVASESSNAFFKIERPGIYHFSST